MTKANLRRERLSVDMLPQEHRQIKACAAMHGETMRDYVLDCIRERLQHEFSKKETFVFSDHVEQDAVLKKLWDNKKDALYDRL
jgi:uncharacterized protein (DUF1778 family)